MNKRLSFNPILYDVCRLVNRLEKHSVLEPMSGCRIWTGTLSGKQKRPVIVTKKSIREYNRHSAARVAYFCAYGPFDENLDVCHHCDNKFCIEPKHLFLGTQLDNNRDRHRKGRTRIPGERGEQRYNAKLKDKWINSIRVLRKDGWGYREIAEQFGVSYSTIRNIFNAGNWRHVKESV